MYDNEIIYYGDLTPSIPLSLGIYEGEGEVIF
jgi:hypothetical protein